MDLNSVKKGHFASVLPQLLSTHLTSSFNIRWVQLWPRTFPLCNVKQNVIRCVTFSENKSHLHLKYLIFNDNLMKSLIIFNLFGQSI